MKLYNWKTINVNPSTKRKVAKIKKDLKLHNNEEVIKMLITYYME